MRQGLGWLGVMMVASLSPAGCVCFVPVDELPPDSGSISRDGGAGGRGGGVGGGAAGGGGSFWTLTDAQTAEEAPATALFQGTVHVFAHDPINNDLRWCPDAVAGCAWQTLDGAGGANGRTTGDVAAECITAVTWGSALHVFYRQDFPATAGHTLRHGLYSGGSWSFETLDGAGGTHGRTMNRVGGCPSASPWSVWLFIGYYDYDDRALRLGWYGGVDWDFLTHDGNGGTSGRNTADVGYWSSAISTGTAIRFYYSDATNQDLREASWGGSADWTFTTRDGQGQGITGRIAAVFHAPETHVFYFDATAGNLRHAWENLAWNYETFDAATPNGGVTAASTTDGLHVFYGDAIGGNLRHAWGLATWTFETADGDSTLGGRLDADLGRNPASLGSGTAVRVVYEGPSQTIRHAAW